MTFLSVVIPTFNSELTIDRCLNSLVCQTYQDFEICIIDAASSDRTIAKVNQFRSKFQNIRIISEPDLGIYDAMNKGISFSKGEWTYFLGSDDEIHSNDVFADIFLNESNLGNDVLYGNVNSERLGNCYDGEFDCDKLYVQNICHQAIFLKKTVFEKIGLYNLSYKVWADYDHNVRWFFDKRISKKFIGETIANYSDIGISSFNEDLLFLSHRPFMFLKRGFFRLRHETQAIILSSIEERAKSIHPVLFFTTKIVRRCHQLVVKKLWANVLSLN